MTNKDLNNKISIIRFNISRINSYLKYFEGDDNFLKQQMKQLDKEKSNLEKMQNEYPELFV